MRSTVLALCALTILIPGGALVLVIVAQASLSLRHSRRIS
jgi:hypothetical protein